MERQGSDGEAVGPVWVDTYEGKDITPVRSEEWHTNELADLKHSLSLASTASPSSPTRR
jgi:hypothetical protein